MVDQERSSLTPFLVAAIAVIMLWILSGVAVYISFDNWPDRGTFGDTFGVINALFSGLAFSGIIYTILLQRQELRLQRKELELTRRELKRSADAQAKSEKALSIQAKSLTAAAKLNALNLVIEAFNQRIIQGELNLSIKREAYLKQLEQILQELTTYK